MVQRKFTFDDQMAFAELSGDYNPLHVDPVAARRLIFGRPVVHGVHAFLWALDNWLEEYRIPLDLCAVRVVFRSAIGVDETVNSSISCEGKNHVEIELVGEIDNAARIYVDWSHSKSQRSEFLSTEHPEKRKCRTLSTEEVATASGFRMYISSKIKIFTK